MIIKPIDNKTRKRIYKLIKEEYKKSKKKGYRSCINIIVIPTK